MLDGDVHVFVGAIVANAQDDIVRGVAPGRLEQDTLYGSALGHASWLDLHNGAASNHLHRLVAEHALQMVQQLLCLYSATKCVSHTSHATRGLLAVGRGLS